MTFGEKLQKLRTRAGLSQDQLAELLDVSRQAVSKWERNEAMPEAEKLVRISRQFGVSTDYLLLEELEEPETASTTAPAAAAVMIRDAPFQELAAAPTITGVEANTPM